MMRSMRHVLTDRVWVWHCTGLSDAGDPLFDAGRELCARIEDETKLVIDPDGNETRAGHRIATDVSIPFQSRVALPGEQREDPSGGHRPLTFKRAASPFGGAEVFETWL